MFCFICDAQISTLSSLVIHFKFDEILQIPNKDVFDLNKNIHQCHLLVV